MFVLLDGPKGSGKSHVGRTLERVLGVRFFLVEPLWMVYYAACQAAGRQPSILDLMTDDRRYRYTAKDEYNNMSFDFWCKWLLLVSILFMIFGLIIALFPDSPLFALHTAALERAFFNGTMPEVAAHLRGFLFGPLGGTIAGYFLLQAFVVWGPFRHRERWAWHAVLWSMLLWFVVDSGMSVYHGAFFNVWMINLWTLLLVGLPLAMTRRAFRKESPPSVSPPVPGGRAGFRYFSTHQ